MFFSYWCMGFVRIIWLSYSFTEYLFGVWVCTFESKYLYPNLSRLRSEHSRCSRNRRRKKKTVFTKMENIFCAWISGIWWSTLYDVLHLDLLFKVFQAYSSNKQKIVASDVTHISCRWLNMAKVSDCISCMCSVYGNPLRDLWFHWLVRQTQECNQSLVIDTDTDWNTFWKKNCVI